MTTGQPLGLRTMLGFYLPLVLTSQMMTLSNPLINLALSRADDPKLHLAAWGVAFGFTVFLNAPILITRDIAAGLADCRPHYRGLVLISILAGLGTAVLDLVVAFTPVGTWVFRTLLDSTPRVTAEAQRVALSVAPIPVFVGMRGLRAGLAMRAHRTPLLTQATFCRIVVLSLVLLTIPRVTDVRASTVGWSLSLGIGAETIWLLWATRDLVLQLPPEPEGKRLTLTEMFLFGWPLVVSAFIWTALRPVINGILGRTDDSEAAQASFGVLHPVILLTGSALWSLQSSAQILATDRDRARRFLAFGLTMTALFTSLVLLLGWIPVWRAWLLTDAFTLPPALLEYTRPAMKMLFVAPLLLGIRACFKGMILASRRTGVISLSSTAELVMVFAVGSVALAVHPQVNGAVLGVLLVIVAETVEALMLGTSASRRFGLLRQGLADPALAPREEGARARDTS